MVELEKAGLNIQKQIPIEISYDGVIVGQYTADLLVENKILVELKAVKKLDEIHFAQCMNYLKATNLKICLLMNFGKPKVKIRRVVNDF
jgi:GxxExxY protein